MIEVTGVSKVYRKRGREIRALDEVSLSVPDGVFAEVRGPSGCGKSTLLMILGAMLTPTAGAVQVDRVDPYAMSSAERGTFRAERIGFVFQLFHLLPYLSAMDNVLIASAQGGRSSKQRAEELLEGFGLGSRMHHRPSELSAGERQRVAVARAMINRPKLILADEPTGSLDPESGEAVTQALEGFVRDGGTVIMATHAEAIEERGDRVRLEMHSGRLVEREAVEV